MASPTKPRVRPSAVEWLQALVAEIAALTDDYCLIPFRVVATALVCDVLQDLRCPFDLYSVGVSAYGGPPRAKVRGWADLPAEESEMRDWLRAGGTVQTAGYGTREPTDADPYLIVHVRGEYLLDLSAPTVLHLADGSPFPAVAFHLDGGAVTLKRFLVADVSSLPLLAYELFPPPDLSPEGRLYRPRAARADALKALWHAMEWYGWPVTLGNEAAKEARGHG